MKKSASSTSLEVLHQQSLKQLEEIDPNISKKEKRARPEKSDSGSESGKEEQTDFQEENYTVEGLLEENSILVHQNQMLQKQIEQLRRLLLQVFSDTRSMLLTEDTIKEYLPAGSVVDDEVNEVEEYSAGEHSGAEHSGAENTKEESIETLKPSMVEEEQKDFEVESKQDNEDVADYEDEGDEQQMEEGGDHDNESKGKKKKKKNNKKKTKPKKPNSIINKKGRSTAKKKLRKLKKKTKKRKLLRQLFVGTKGVLFGDQSNKVKQPETTQLKLKVFTEISKYTPIVKETATRELEQLLIKEKQKGDFNGFYFVNLGVVVEKWILWKKLMPRVKAFYAVKSNPDVNIVRTLALLGAGFDCASKPELEEAISLKAKSEDIIFANPCKGRDHIQFAKENGITLMTFDNVAELNKIISMYKEAQLVLRILPDDSHSLMPFGTKFGASLSDSITLIERCVALGANLVGVSFHVGSGCFSSAAWPEAIELARKVWDAATKHGFNMRILDIGGGFPGTSDAKLKFEDIAAAASKALDEIFPEKHIRIIAEPGRYFCTEAYTLAVTIISKRTKLCNPRTQAQNKFTIVGEETIDHHSETNDNLDDEPQKKKLYYLSDGVYGSFNNIVFDHASPIPIPLKTFDENAELHKSCLFGPTCDSIDVICKDVDLPELELDDWIYFPNMGAYTIASASSFNGFRVPNARYIMLLD